MSISQNSVIRDPFPSLPSILKGIPNWVAWKLVDDTKPPFIVGTNFKARASSTDASTWTDFATAISKTTVNGTEGVGFVIGGSAIEKELVGVDIDGCRNPKTGELAPWADKLTDVLDSYGEVTPSKTGIRVWVFGKWPFKEHVFNLDPAAGFGEKVKIEVYNSGRYFTVTGDSLYEEEVPIEKRDLTDTYNLCLNIQAQHPPASKAKTESVAGSTVGQGARIQHESGVITNKYELLMNGAIQSTNPFVITDGRGNSLEYASHSEADLALCTALALKHGDNADLIWGDYLKSALRREKWVNREDYFRENTIKKAIETAQAMLSTPPIIAKQPEISNDVEVGSAEEEQKILRIEARVDRTDVVRPVFPHFVMEGTSIYRNLAGPVAQTSGKHETMLFMPAFIGLMNYAAGRVGIRDENVVLVQHLGLVSPAGDYHKSSSCAVAFDYLSKADLLTYSKLNPGGKIIQIQGGSSEGIGKLLYRVNAKHAIVFYDELSKVCAKASIQNSALASDILTWAESGPFENTIKSTSDTFSFAPNSYWFSWVWCTTERGFDKQWGLLTEKESGLADRVCIVLSDEIMKEGANHAVDYSGAIDTRMLVEKAIARGVIPYYDFDDVQKRLNGLNKNKRSEGKAKAFALAFAIDLGREIIDEDCIARGTALAQYLWDVRHYLKPIEGANVQGRLINEIIHELRRNGGLMKYRDLCRALTSLNHGDLWDKSYKWLITHDEILDYTKSVETNGGKQITHLVGIVKHEDWE